jgi:hypothetical protein
MLNIGGGSTVEAKLRAAEPVPEGVVLWAELETEADAKTDAGEATRVDAALDEGSDDAADSVAKGVDALLLGVASEENMEDDARLGTEDSLAKRESEEVACEAGAVTVTVTVVVTSPNGAETDADAAGAREPVLKPDVEAEGYPKTKLEELPSVGDPASAVAVAEGPASLDRKSVPVLVKAESNTKELALAVSAGRLEAAGVKLSVEEAKSEGVAELALELGTKVAGTEDSVRLLKSGGISWRRTFMLAGVTGTAGVGTRTTLPVWVEVPDTVAGVEVGVSVDSEGADATAE